MPAVLDGLGVYIYRRDLPHGLLNLRALGGCEKATLKIIIIIIIISFFLFCLIVELIPLL